MHASENCRFIDTEYGTSVSCIQFEHMATCPWSRAHGHMLMVTCSWSLTRRTRGQARHNPAIWEEQKTSECSHASIPLLALRALLSYPHSSPPPLELASILIFKIINRSRETACVNPTEARGKSVSKSHIQWCLCKARFAHGFESVGVLVEKVISETQGGCTDSQA